MRVCVVWRVLSDEVMCRRHASDSPAIHPQGWSPRPPAPGPPPGCSASTRGAESGAKCWPLKSLHALRPGTAATTRTPGKPLVSHNPDPGKPLGESVMGSSECVCGGVHQPPSLT